jgi:sigma-B regulation protein RsbU (phosphoserine phosphatase)
MPRALSLPRPILLALALALAGAATLHGIVWMYYVRQSPTAHLGIEFVFEREAAALRLTRVADASAARRAGLQPDDRLTSINGRPLADPTPFYDSVTRGRPGDRVELTVLRPGTAKPLQLTAILGAAPPGRVGLSPPATVALGLIESFPVPFLAVAIPVLFLRLRDPHAWLLALLFAGFVAGGPVFPAEPLLHPALRGFALAYKVVFFGLFPAFFYWFFAVFPAPSPLEQRSPWLKRSLLAASALVVVPLGAALLWAGNSTPADALVSFVGREAARAAFIAYGFGAVLLGLASLLWNSLRGATAETCRKTRVILWGTIFGFTPFVLMQAAAVYFRTNPYDFPFWVWAPCILAILLVPLSFAYAVVKHRVLEIPVLLKRSARYLIVRRGFALLVVLLSSLTAGRLARAASDTFASEPATAAGVGVLLGAALGILLAVSVTQVGERITRRIDRAFFRNAYDTRQILEDLAEKTRTATSRREIAQLLERHARDALQPAWLTAYFNHGDARFLSSDATASPAPLVLPSPSPLLSRLSETTQPLELPPAEDPANEAPLFGNARPEVLVPLQGRDAQLEGVLALGPRLSEEPYAAEDKRLLASVASQVGVALENIRLAEQMAARFEAEHRLQRDLEIARQVQERLFPQKHPALATLDYAGACLQARTVGGDYYDFLDFGEGRLGLVLADIAGKGIAAALLMANLQANLRSQYALALEDLSRLVGSVNRLFIESSQPHHYATFFFGLYDDAGRRLRYVNCGHNPPVVLRTAGSVDRLGTTATVLGLFEDWSCTIGETSLLSGDTLVVFSDGVTEAFSDEGVEFGDPRLIEAVRAHAALPPAELLAALARTVIEFSGREQEDDLTLLVARSV